MFCPNCGKQITEDSVFCPYCAQRVKRKNKRNAKKAVTVGLIIVASVVALIVAFYVGVPRWRQIQYNRAVSLFYLTEYEEAQKIFKKIESYQDSRRYLHLIKDTLAEWDEVYKTATEYFYNGEYSKAIDYYSAIPNYRDANEKVEESAELICQDAEERMEAHDYQSALSLLDEIPEGTGSGKKKEELKNQILNAINAEQYEKACALYEEQSYKEAQELFMKLEDYENSAKYLSELGNIYFEQAKAFQNSGDYTSCFKQLEHIDDAVEWSDYHQAVELKNKIKFEYTENVKSNAKNVLTTEGYEAFASYVDSAVNQLFTASDKEDLLDEYEKYRPVFLKDLDAVDIKNWSDKDVHGTTDTFGNNYYDSLILRTGYTDEFYRNYLINGQYNHLSGILAYDGDCYRDHDYTVRYGQGAGHMKIYADDKVVYASPIINASTAPIPIDVTLGNDVHMLRIVWQTDNEWQAYMLLGDAQLYYTE